MLVTLQEIIGMAEKGNYCIPAFNVYNTETVMGVFDAAEEAKAPVIMQVYPRLFNEYVGYYLAPAILAAAKKATVPVCFHLDHGPSEAEVMKALRLGATGIMLDGSTHPFEENVALTKHIVESCKAVGIGVEGELGHVGSAAAGDETGAYTEVAAAAEFVEKTGVKALAVMVGTAHGKYKKAPVLAIDRIAELHKATNAHLVLHGGSGVPDDQIKAAVKAGIRKINYATDVCCAFIEGCKKLDPYSEPLDKYLMHPTEDVKNFAIDRIKVLGADKYSK